MDKNKYLLNINDGAYVLSEVLYLLHLIYLFCMYYF